LSLATAAPSFASALGSILRPGMTVALGDGVGELGTLADGSLVGEVLSATARDVGSVRLVLGWMPAPVEGISPDAFSEVRAVMPGWGVRDVLRSPTAGFIPCRLSAVPALLTGSLRPDVLITRVVERDGRLHFGTEVSWQRELIEAGIPVLAVVDSASPAASAEAFPNTARLTVAGHSSEGPVQVPQKAPEALHDALADAVLALIPEGARLQYGPGQLGTALLTRTTRPLRIDTGLLTDAVVDLDRRRLLIGVPSATYLLGSDTLYDWADGRPILRGIDYTHSFTRLAHGHPLVAVNTAVEIDPFGQINVEGLSDNIIGGIGGHPDYCAAAAANRGGMSIIAVPSSYGGRSPLVEHLSRPASTPAYDVDVIVTEKSHADLRGAGWSQRRALIIELFDR
jgi:acyl-CoA hydrolase